MMVGACRVRPLSAPNATGPAKIRALRTDPLAGWSASPTAYAQTSARRQAGSVTAGAGRVDPLPAPNAPGSVKIRALRADPLAGRSVTSSPGHVENEEPPTELRGWSAANERHHTSMSRKMRYPSNKSRSSPMMTSAEIAERPELEAEGTGLHPCVASPARSTARRLAFRAIPREHQPAKTSASKFYHRCPRTGGGWPTSKGGQHNPLPGQRWVAYTFPSRIIFTFPPTSRDERPWNGSGWEGSSYHDVGDHGMLGKGDIPSRLGHRVQRSAGHDNQQQTARGE